MEPEKKKMHRVSMQQLINANYIRENQIIYTKNKQHPSTILSDGNIKNGVGSGSIHKIGALIKGTDSCNGWMHWYYEEAGRLKQMDEYRKKYREEHGIL